MNKVLVFTWCCLLGSDLCGQRIDCIIHPSFDAPATVQLQTVNKNNLQLIFSQAGRKSRPVDSLTWIGDTTKLVHVRNMGRYFQQFAFSDTVTLTSREAPSFFEAYRDILAQAKTLAAQRDDRFLVDGLTCEMTVFNDSGTSYLLSYSTPVYEDNQLINKFLRGLLLGLKMKSKNPATVNYCMVADVYTN